MARRGRHRPSTAGGQQGRARPREPWGPGTGAVPGRGKDHLASSHRPQGAVDRSGLLAEVDAAVAEREPLSLLSFVSALVAATDVDLHPSVAGRPLPGHTLDELIGTFIDVDDPATSALLAVIAHIAPQPEQREAARDEVSRRRPGLPRWLRRLDDVRYTSAELMTHILNDGDNVAFGIELPDRRELTFVAYVDHNLGTVVKDAFVIPDAMAVTSSKFRRISAGQEGTRFVALSPAQARATVEAALVRTDTWDPMIETDTWPMCRPLLEWALRQLPEGGEAPPRRRVSDDEIDSLLDRYVASSTGSGLDSPQRRQLARAFIDAALAPDGTGDPLRTSPVTIELALMGDLPPEIIAVTQRRSVVPSELAAWVEFTHRERHIPVGSTQDTLDALDHWAEVFLTRADGGVDRDSRGAGLALDVDDHPFFRELVEELTASVGGPDALATLDPDPLPDEAFRWSGIDSAAREQVQVILDLIDGCCVEVFDTEYRTACRRLLADAARRQPKVFTRRGNPATLASAIVWIVGKANNAFTARLGRGVEVQEIAVHFGLTNTTSFSQRAGTVLKALGVDPDEFRATLFLGSADYLVSDRRRTILVLTS